MPSGIELSRVPVVLSTFLATDSWNSQSKTGYKLSLMQKMVGYNLPSISWFNIIETRFALTAVLFITT
jgi:hypothetical protein